MHTNIYTAANLGYAINGRWALDRLVGRVLERRRRAKRRNAAGNEQSNGTLRCALLSCNIQNGVDAINIHLHRQVRVELADC